MVEDATVDVAGGVDGAQEPPESRRHGAGFRGAGLALHNLRRPRCEQVFLPPMPLLSRRFGSMRACEPSRSKVVATTIPMAFDFCRILM